MNWEIRHGHVLDRLREMPDESVNCCVTSPPYWGLRAYETDPQVWPGTPEWVGELGAEPTYQLYVEHMKITERRLSQDVMNFELAV